jgi:hypothetical protein
MHEFSSSVPLDILQIGKWTEDDDGLAYRASNMPHSEKPLQNFKVVAVVVPHYDSVAHTTLSHPVELAFDSVNLHDCSE